MANFVPAVKTSELAPGQGKVVELQGQAIALFNVEGQYYALDNTCAHRSGPLGEGQLNGTNVKCPWHWWEYDVRTGEYQGVRVGGKLMGAARDVKVRTFPIRVEGDVVLVGL